MKHRYLLAVMILLLNIASAQEFTDPEYFEDFEDDINDANPTDNWYVYHEYCDFGSLTACLADGDILRVEDPGLNNTGLSFRYRTANPGSNPSGENAMFRFNEATDITTIEFVTKHNSAVNSQNTLMYVACGVAAQQQNLLNLATGNRHFGLTITRSATENIIREGWGGSGTILFQFAAGGNNEIQHSYTITGTTMMYSIEDDVGNTASGSTTIEHCSTANVIVLSTSNNVNKDMDFDELTINGAAPEAIEEGGVTASEFEDGIFDFATGLGFISLESKYFFGIILVAIASIITFVVFSIAANRDVAAKAAVGSGFVVGVFLVVQEAWELWTLILITVVLIGAVVTPRLIRREAMDA